MRGDSGVVEMGFVLHWMVLFAFWLVLSGMFDGFHLGLGLACTAAVAVLSRQMQLVSLGRGDGETHHVAETALHRQFLYSFWLLREIAVANWQVVKIVLNPKLPIDPALIRFDSSVTSDLGITIMANSITLTPGTITLEVEQGEFLIHALVDGEAAVDGVRSIQERVIAALPSQEQAAAT
jgi:multicomponent Na+:H+ antiporter subunit E